MARIPLIQADAFTPVAFGGNPAAVALFDELPDDGLLQQIALEMNLSETAYPTKRGDGDWDLRWFTPGAEVNMCGHATLATAFVLADQGLIDGRVTFHTKSGPLTCEVTDAGVVMDFPSSPVSADPLPDGLVEALSDALGAVVIDVGVGFDVVAQLQSADAVRSLTPDQARVAGIDTRAVIVTASGDIDGGPADFVSRVFAPRVGIAEDPVTGSAHTILAPWWAERLGVTDFAAHQVSARGGRLGVRLLGDRVELSGQAVITMVGELVL